MHTFHPQFEAVFQGYIDKKRTNGSAEDTLKSCEIYLYRFSNYLNSRGIADIRDVNETVVLGFTDTFIQYSPSIIHNTLCSLRTFFHYLFQNNFVSKDFAYIVPHDGYRQRTKVPSAYPQDDVETLLKSIDRGNPKGKRVAPAARKSRAGRSPPKPLCPALFPVDNSCFCCYKYSHED